VPSPSWLNKATQRLCRGAHSSLHPLHSFAMSLPRRILGDLRRGENVDAYATAAVAVVLVILSLVGVIPDSKLAGVTLAVLPLLAVTLLVTRARVEAIRAAGIRADENVITTERPSSLEDDLESSRDLMLCGVALVQQIARHHDSIIQKLRAGGSVRVLLIKPGSAGARLTADQSAQETVNYSQARAINSTIAVLKTTAKMTQGKLELRLTPQELSFGAAWINPGSSHPRLYIYWVSV